ncbi:saccharopine dehydrogenase [Anaeramoeba ignava]|uniref:Saccharopine dehydrogenase n=1 Tax=Anaeramoeba ignava TaxID=1746090 RepID=A0A9Q0LWH4_ANAIG|nr:saccharopine dehydrogenase [Anaeramoeba ignava]|eukprot:Anaeramoba_ignava/a356925_132.p1 GENE.a356925_132~~a356925_132.p1  ORF type:complete len:374 (-),score=145.32 a356925_132:40-1161(-)
MLNILILGGGMQGSIMARDLVETGQYKVTVADRDEAIAKKLKEFGIEFIQLDFSDKEAIKKAVEPFDFIVGAVPSFLGYNMFTAVLEAGKSIADISFTPQDVMELDSLAKKNGVTAIVDCGVAPGLSNLMFGIGAKNFDSVDSITCYVGGLPQKESKREPYNYFSVFCTSDVIEEYTREPRIFRDGKVVTVEPLSELETIDTGIEEIGKLEAFNTDGLRSLLTTFNHVPNLIEKTLRYPGHVDLIQKLYKEKAFEEPKLKETLKQITEEWKPREGDKDLLFMRVTLKGKKEDKELEESYDLYQKYDEEKKISAMSQTTAFTGASSLELIAQKIFTQPGVFPLELIAKLEGSDNKYSSFLFDRLKKRGIEFHKK